MPSILIETGFITNKSEGAFLKSKSGQQKVAKAIADAILKYKKHLDENYVYEAPKRTEPVAKKSRFVKGVDFKVQIATSTKKLPLKSYNFNGLKGVKRKKDGNFYKYYYGMTSDYDAINKMKNVAKKNGYPTAFVVAFRGDKKISVSNALLQTKH
jgi:N-acetylmuramoyl-L-alanine amidase